DFAQDMATGLWADHRVDSEWSKLKAVLLYAPGSELAMIRDPKSVQHLARLDWRGLRREILNLGRVYRELGVKVYFFKPRLLLGRWGRPPVNLVFMRDLFTNTRNGAVVARMASRVRAGEEKFASVALAARGVPLRATISGHGLLEGADFLWLNRHTV